jgi:Transposase DDE domain group 1
VKGIAVAGVVLDPGRESLVSSSGGLLLRQTIGLSGVERVLSAALARWRGRRAVHDPAKVLVDVAAAVALGGDCVADLAVVRAQPELFGPVASDPTVSRLITVLAADVEESLPAIRAARARARAAVWARRRPVAGAPGRRGGGMVAR